MTASSLERSAGVLLHPTSLPGPFGIGDLGPMAYRWVETLAAMKQSWWQVLPLGPTGAGDSPYQSFSAFAGAINLLSPELLEREGLVSSALWAGKHFADGFVDFDQVNAFKRTLLRSAWENFQGGKGPRLRDEFEEYRKLESAWLHDFALYMALRESLHNASFSEWPKDLARREQAALTVAEKSLSDAIGMQEFGQFLFDRQWKALRSFAAERGVRILGDVPIFVALDSADVWAHPDQFLLDDNLKPTVVAGVPPDYFSEDGQHWGNPIYDWERMSQTGYSWWVARIARQLEQVDLVRLDHFRGFCQAWHIPAGEKTARNGKWVDGPGAKLFERLRTALGSSPFVAEDLGLITPDVHALRDSLQLPGMRVLQFALTGPDNVHWPHNFVANTSCYTGTHDNETANGWFAGLSEKDRHYMGLMLGRHIHDPAWEMIWMAWSSVAVLAVAPFQDVLGLGNEARMNKPGVPTGNWRWRFRIDQFRPDMIARVRDLTVLFNRVPKNPS